MIIIFHSLYFLLKHIVKIYRTAKALKKYQTCRLMDDEVKMHTNCIITPRLDVKFDPPLFRQRYCTVQQILLNSHWKSNIKKVVEFGCAEMNLFPYMKHLYDITEIVFVDIDENHLQEHRFKVHPLTVDYLKRRPSPLNVYVLAGSISQPDSRLLGCDAVIGIELIEHLYPDTLEGVPYNVFQYIKPFLVIFTTPNYEFNEIFTSKNKFRHTDHKFEWTREQFESWALNITMRFPNYTVRFDGIGGGPQGKESLGHASQMAVFIRHTEQQIPEEQLSEVPRACREIEYLTDTEILDESHGICTYYSFAEQLRQYSGRINHEPNRYYTEIEYIEYPYHIDNRKPEERTLQDVKYKILSAATNKSRFYNEEQRRLEYPVYELVVNEDGYFSTVTELSNLLRAENFTVEECISFHDNEPVQCVVYDIMDNRSSSPSSNSNNSDDRNAYKQSWSKASDNSDWDAEYIPSLKISEDVVETEEKVKKEEQKETGNDIIEPKVTYQFHSTLATTSSVENKEEVKKERNNSKRQSGSHSKIPGTSATHNENKTPKKGTNIKNRDIHISSQSSSKENDSKKRKSDTVHITDSHEKKIYKKNIEMKVHDSAHSQSSSLPKSNRSGKNPSNIKSSNKGKIMTTSSLKRFPIKSDDSCVPSTSDLKKKKKGKKLDEDKEDIKNLTECIIYNTLNNITEVDETGDEPSSSRIPNKIINAIPLPNPLPELPNIELTNMILTPNPIDIGQEIMDHILTNTNFDENINKDIPETSDNRNKDLLPESINQELNHASREALFDPNSETDMLEEFEIPPAPPMPLNLISPAMTDHRNVIVIGFNNEDESVALPDNADPFPNWLLQLLGSNVEESESHDEPHFYCQGDGIGVHPSVIEVEIDEEDSSSDSTSSHDEAEAEHTISESGILPLLPSDDVDDADNQSDSTVTEMSLPSGLLTTPGTTSAADSTDEFYDSIEENLPLSERQNLEISKKK